MYYTDIRKLQLKEETLEAICNIYNSFREKDENRGRYWIASQAKTEVRALLSTLSQTEIAEVMALRNIGRGKGNSSELNELIESYLAQDYFSPLQRLSKDKKLDNWLSIGIAKSGAIFKSNKGKRVRSIDQNVANQL